MDDYYCNDNEKGNDYQRSRFCHQKGAVKSVEGFEDDDVVFAKSAPESGQS